MTLDRYDIEYNGDTGVKHNVLLYDYPEIEQAKRNYNIYHVPGRNGELISTGQYLGNITIGCVFSVISENFMNYVHDLKRWLSGNGKLRLHDTPDAFYEVLKVEYESIERELRQYGQFTVRFVCYPYEFKNDGQMEFEREECKYNPYDRCMPLYKITGEGQCTLNVNDKTMTANVGQSLKIDSRRMIAYREDGEMMNTSVVGDYENLWLSPRDNSISISTGFKLKIVPRWGYDA